MFSIESKFIITEFLQCVSQFGDHRQGLLHEHVSVTFDKREACKF